MQSISRGAATHLFVLVLGVGIGAGGCRTVSPELVEQRQFDVFEEPISRLAVLPFYPRTTLSRSTHGSGTSAWEAAALVTRFVTDAVAERGIQVIPESDVQLAFAGSGVVTPRADPLAAALIASTQFGANAVLLGEVERYRERSGSSYGSESAASVQFEVTLYEAPGGRKIWMARFDQTQPSITSNLFTATRYPGGGTRFLTVAELAQWGAGLVAAAMPVGADPGAVASD